jgi:hypothetical protein
MFLALKSNLINTARRSELVELSRQFVMVNVDEPDEPKGPQYAPDGYYFPRILFFGCYQLLISNDVIVLFVDDNGVFMPAAINVGGIPDKKYYHGGIDSVINTMKNAIDYMKRRNVAHDDQHEELLTTTMMSVEQSTTTTTTTAPITTTISIVPTSVPNKLARGWLCRSYAIYLCVL